MPRFYVTVMVFIATLLGRYHSFQFPSRKMCLKVVDWYSQGHIFTKCHSWSLDPDWVTNYYFEESVCGSVCLAKREAFWHSLFDRYLQRILKGQCVCFGQRIYRISWLKRIKGPSRIEDKQKMQNWEVDLWQHFWVVEKRFYISVRKPCSIWFQCVIKCYVVEEGWGPLQKDSLCQRWGHKESSQQRTTGWTAQTLGRTRRLKWATKETLETFPYWELSSPTEGSGQPLLLNLKERGCERSEISYCKVAYRKLTWHVSDDYLWGYYIKNDRSSHLPRLEFIIEK